MQSGDILNSRYEIRRMLGEGGMGAVWLAWDQALEKEVALKTLLPQTLSDLRAAQQLKREVRLSQELRHDNICATYDFHESGRAPFLVMEYVEGDTLSNFIFRQPGHRCSPATFQALAPQILDAVGYAHRKGVVHRDLKSGNIMVTRDGTVKLMDFGIAASLKETYSRTTGAPISLSVHYASPEQINGAKPTPAMDIYSLGCVFHEMLAGEPPFTHGDVLHQQLTRTPDPIGDVPAHLNAALRACLEKDASARPASAEAIRGLLERTSTPAVEKTVRVERQTPPFTHPTVAPIPSPPPSEEPHQPAPLPPYRQSAHPVLPKVLLGCAALLLLGFIPWITSNRAPSPRENYRPEQVNPAPPGPVASQGENRESPVTLQDPPRPAQPVERRVEQSEPERPVVPQIAMEFVRIPAGEFMMGCSPGDGECQADERPSHRVRITKAFEMGKYEVTQAQWQAVMGLNRSRIQRADHPVEHVSWNDAQQFLSRLNTWNDGYRYRLPTEAEWEYAARGGSASKYHGDLSQIAWYDGNSGLQTQPVGQKQPNAWGLYDMLGNVREWCSDWYAESYYSASPPTNPKGPDSGASRTLRGGSLHRVGDYRVSCRDRSSPDYHIGALGFRCVRERIP